MSDDLMEFDLNDYDPEKAEGSSEPVKPGRAHLRVHEFELNGGKNGSHKIVLEVLAHEADARKPANEWTEPGKMVYEYVPNKSQCMYRMRELAVGAGLVTRDELNQAKAEGRGVAVDWSKVKDRQLFAKIENSEYNGNLSAAIAGKGAAFKPLDHPDCREWPRHQAMYEKGLELLKGQPVAAGASEPDDDDF